jgi:hypothetical protein
LPSGIGAPSTGSNVTSALAGARPCTAADELLTEAVADGGDDEGAEQATHQAESNTTARFIARQCSG